MNLRGGKELTEKIMPGDTVYLTGLSHRPLMLVIGVFNNKCHCIWFDEKFHKEELEVDPCLLERTKIKMNAIVNCRNYNMYNIPLESVIENIKEFVISDQKIQAIKIIREKTGLGLKEAKDYFEGIPYEVKKDLRELSTNTINIDNYIHRVI